MLNKKPLLKTIVLGALLISILITGVYIFITNKEVSKSKNCLLKVASEPSLSIQDQHIVKNLKDNYSANKVKLERCKVDASTIEAIDNPADQTAALKLYVRLTTTAAAFDDKRTTEAFADLGLLLNSRLSDSSRKINTEIPKQSDVKIILVGLKNEK